jgi:hypothetical protein
VLWCSYWVFKLGCSSWVVQICAFKLGVQVGAFGEFLVSILRWSKPPHHVKVNPLGEGSPDCIHSTLVVTLPKKMSFSSGIPLYHTRQRHCFKSVIT